MDFASLMMAEFPAAMQPYNYAQINNMSQQFNNQMVPFNQISQDATPIHSMNIVQERPSEMMNNHVRQFNPVNMMPDRPLCHNPEIDKPFQCQTCFKRFARQGQLARHAQSHITGQGRHLNTISKHTPVHFDGQQKLMHTQNMDERLFAAHAAGPDNVNKDAHAHHHVNKVPKEEPIVETNPFLEMALKTARELKEKQNSKERPYECPTCLKRFLTKTHLRRHLNTKTHLTGQCKPIIVDNADGQKTQLYGLNGPINVGPGKEKPFQCQLCQKRFTTQNHLKRHSEVHFGVKRFSCDVCHKTFLRSENLNIHKRMHSGERPYQCQVCFRRFSQPSSLKNHQKTHSDFKEFQCAVCMKAFKAKCSLKRHLKLMHGDGI